MIFTKSHEAIRLSQRKQRCDCLEKDIRIDLLLLNWGARRITNLSLKVPHELWEFCPFLSLQRSRWSRKVLTEDEKMLSLSGMPFSHMLMQWFGERPMMVVTLMTLIFLGRKIYANTLWTTFQCMPRPQSNSEFRIGKRVPWQFGGLLSPSSYFSSPEGPGRTLCGQHSQPHALDLVELRLVEIKFHLGFPHLLFDADWHITELHPSPYCHILWLVLNFITLW